MWRLRKPPYGFLDSPTLIKEVPMPYGYTGKILHVDLNSGSLTVEEPPESFYRKYMGGSAMGMFYICGIPAGIDALA
jgi:aldehyde:ferredoxin oxidoreductase